MTRRVDQEANAAAPIDPADVLGAGQSFADFSRIVADYCEQIGMSRATLDAEAFIGSGHAAKALARRARKKLGWVTWGRVLAALGLRFYLVRDPAAKIPASSVASRNGNSRDHHWRNVKGTAWGKRMAALRALKLPAERRSEIARIAAKASHRGSIAAPAATPGTATNKRAPAPPPSRSRTVAVQLSMFETGTGSSDHP
jgi:hypothetical protein